MNVLILHNRYRAAGGEERSLAEIEALLRERGHQVERFERSSAQLGKVRAATGMLRGGLAPAEVAGAGLCVRFEIRDSSGRPLDCYTQKVVSRTGRFEMVLPLALNEAPGRYTVAAEEIVSGLRAEAEFDVGGHGFF